MGTKIKNEISKNNPYYIEPHRYMELKHFCLQYPIWKKAYKAIEAFSTSSVIRISDPKTGFEGNVVTKCVDQLLYYSERIEMVENTVRKISTLIYPYLLYGVTEGMTYEEMQANMNFPCSRSDYYKMYREFFYELNKVHY